jgi:hypothetical protein
MPRRVQPGGVSGMSRVRYTARRKLGLISAVRAVMENEGMSMNKAAASVSVSPSLISRWIKQSAILHEALLVNKKSVHPGPVGHLSSIEDQVLRFIFELREMGMAVNHLMIVLKASTLSSDFAEKLFTARFAAVKRFTKHHSLVYRMGTHMSQRHPEEVEDEATDFLNEVRTKVVGPHCDKRWILNMDQTPVYFTMNNKTTLNSVGARTVHVRTSTSDTKRATVAVTITASGNLLPAVTVFKGTPTGRIATTEFATYPADHFYACQKNAWMDERVMLLWAEKVLKPYVATAPEHVIPLLVLDSYRCHMMAPVVQAIQEMGVEVIHIPGGCTCLCQPVDIGFNKPFKTEMRREWTTWMLFEGLSNGENGATIAPSRLQISQWVSSVYTHMTTATSADIIKNAWLKTGFEWFKE